MMVFIKYQKKSHITKKLKKYIHIHDKEIASKFKKIPILIIYVILISLVAKTMAFGGVAIGIIKAKLAANTIGNNMLTISKL